MENLIFNLHSLFLFAIMCTGIKGFAECKSVQKLKGEQQ